MGADSAAENIPNSIATELSAQFFCPSSKVLDFNEKRLHWSSLVRVLRSTKHNCILKYYVHYLLTYYADFDFAENYSGMFYYRTMG